MKLDNDAFRNFLNLIKYISKNPINKTFKKENPILNLLIKSGIAYYSDKIYKVPFRLEQLISDFNASNNMLYGALILQEIELSVNNKCPLKCKYCYRKNNLNKKAKYLELSQINGLFEDAKKLYSKRLFLTGGEPLIDFDRLLKIVKLAKNKGFTTISVATSGYVGDPMEFKELVKAGATHFLLKIDTSDKNEAKDIYGVKINFQNFEERINTLYENGATIYGNITLTKFNKNNLWNTIDYFAQFPFKVIRVNPIVEVGGGKNNISLPIKEIVQIHNKIHQIQKIKDVAIVSGYETNNKFFNCPGGLLRLFIKENGEVYPCPYAVDFEEISIYKREGDLITIWKNNNLWQEFRQYVPNSKYFNLSYKPKFSSCRIMEKIHYQKYILKK